MQQFALDFTEMKLGRPHQMRFGAYSLYSGKSPEAKKLASTDSGTQSVLQ